MHRIVEIPEIASINCADGEGDRLVRHEKVDGHQRIIICRNRIERVAMNAQRKVADASVIQRNAYRRALEGLRRARDRMQTDTRIAGAARDESLRAMEESIAGLEADMARVD